MTGERWTAQQYRDYLAKQKPGGRTRAVRSFCRFSKHHHASKMEAEYCDWLFARVKAGELRSFKWQVSVPIPIRGKLWKHWKIDFLVIELDGSKSYHECKGWHLNARDYVLRRDAFLLAYPRRELYVNKRLWTGRAKRESVLWRISDVKRLQRSTSAAKRAYSQDRARRQEREAARS